MGLETLLATHPGILLSIATFLLKMGREWRRGKKAEAQRVDDETIRAYLDWLRRQEHADLVVRINRNQDRLLEILAQMGNLEEVVNGVERLQVEFNGVGAVLEQIQALLHKPVLSPIPLDCRWDAAAEMLFRDEDLQALLSMTDDFVVSGQPGVGKTFLLYHYAQQIDGRFVVSNSADDVVASVRLSAPKVVIVDDAADRTDVLKRLQHIRMTSGVSFQVIAICWTFEEDELLQTLGLGRTGVHRLEPVGADNMADFIERRFQALNYSMPTVVIREIRKQAAGRPGLASRLIDLVVQEQSYEPLLDGRVHYEVLAKAFGTVNKELATNILAAFAVGGAGGMGIDHVAKLLGVSSLGITSEMKKLATGGIVSETQYQSLATQPAAFRHALIKEKLLAGGPYDQSPMYIELFSNAPSKHTALETLIDSVAKGASIDRSWLVGRMIEFADGSLWEHLASVDASWCQTVLETYAGAFENIAAPVLHYMPELAIPRLLDRMASAESSSFAHINPAHGSVKNWICSFSREERDGVRRRKMLFEQTKKWMANGGSRTAGWNAIALSLSLEYQEHGFDAGAGRKFTWATSLLSLEEVKQLQPIWTEMLTLAEQFPPRRWTGLINALHCWLHPHSGPTFGDAPLVDVSRQTVSQFLSAFVALSTVPRDAVIKWCVDHDVPLEAEIDYEFSVYCPYDPVREGQDWKKREADNAEKARELGRAWAREERTTVAAKLTVMELQCYQWDIKYPVYDSVIASELAQHVQGPLSWAKELYSSGLSANVICPIVSKALEDGHDCQDLLVTLLNDELCASPVLEIVLSYESLGEAVSRLAMSVLGHSVPTMKRMLIRGSVSDYWADKLLENAADELAVHLCAYDFLSDEKRLLSRDRRKWVEMFERGVENLDRLDSNTFWNIGELVASVPELRLPLSRALIENNKFLSCIYEDLYRMLFDTLSQQEKLELLPLLKGKFSNNFVGIFIGCDLVAYAELLADSELRSHHLEPLRGDPTTADWQAKAILAFDARYAPREIARAVLGDSWISSGSEVLYYDAWINKFAKLSEEDDERLRSIAVAGCQFFSEAKAIAEREERRDEVYGLGDEK